MASERHSDPQSLESLYWKCSALGSKHEREQLLDELCPDKPQLREKVLRMVAAEDDAEYFADDLFPVVDLTDRETRTGTTVGPYKLREKIGEGGFGVVYVAEQEKPIRRKVALKLIKPGMDSEQVIARFEAERQALSMMNHPNIARVLDAGMTPSGRPFFAMELVYGTSITNFCIENRLSINEKLELFVDVCKALHHAHLKGIIHRDIKPSNILITMNDDAPLPKVIDFGVAKALTQSLTEHSIYTAYGQVLGTPMYMSPEQAQYSAQDVDVRTDIYSLGVLLYELLSGDSPFARDQFQKTSLDEIFRMIREVDPPLPSARASTKRVKAASTLSIGRKIDERKLVQSLRGELDWVVMKAIEKNRERRYESALAFAQDIERVLKDEVVEARPPSISYRTRKFVRKNRVLIGVALFFLSSLAIAFLGLASGLVLMIKERNVARANSAQSLYNEANALRLARVPGYRDRVLDLLQKARQEGPDVISVAMATNAVAACLGDFVAVEPELFPLPEGLRTHAFDPQTSRLVVSNADEQLLLLSMNGESVSLASGLEESVQLAKFSGSGRAVAVMGSSGQVRVFQEQEFWHEHALRLSPEWTTCDLFLSDGGTLFACGTSENTVVVIRHEPNSSPAELSTFETQSAITAACFSGNGRQVVVREKNQSTTVFDRETGVPWKILDDGMTEASTQWSVSDSGEQIVCGHRHGIEVLGESLNRFLPGSASSSAAISGDGHLIASLDIAGRLEIWNGTLGRRIALLDPPRHAIQSSRLCFHPGGRRLSLYNDHCVCTWTLSTPERTWLHGHRMGVPCVAFNATGTRLASASADGTVRIWDPQSGNSQTILKGFSYPESMVFTDHDSLIVGDQDGSVTVRSLFDEKIETVRHAPNSAVYSVSASNDGAIIAVADHWKRVEVYRRNDPFDFELIHQLQGRGTVQLTPDGRHLFWLVTNEHRATLIRGFDVEDQTDIGELPDARLKYFLKSITLNERGEIIFISSGIPNRKPPGEESLQDHLVIWDLNSRKMISAEPLFVPGIPRRVHGDSISQQDKFGYLASSWDGQALATTINDVKVVLWSRVDNHFVPKLVLPPEADAIWSLDWNHDASQLAVGTSDGEISVWDVEQISKQFANLEWLE